MKNTKDHELSEFIKETFQELKDYFDLQLRYNKLIAAKKTGEISSFFVLFMIMGFLGAFFLLIASFGFVWWYSRNDPSQRWVGFLIVMGFYFLVGLLVYLFREKIIFKPLKRFTADVFFDSEEKVFKEEVLRKMDENSDGEVILRETVLDLSDPETFELDKEIEAAKIRYKEKRLQAKFEEAKVKFDFMGLAKMAVDSIKEHYFTATMMTKLAFRAIKHLKPGKKSRNKQKQIEKKSGS